MIEYKYKIILNPKYTNRCKLELELLPDNSILRSFMAVIEVSNFDKLIESVTRSERFGVEDAHILFFNEMDWEDKEGLEIEENQLSIYVYDGNPNETVLDELLFDKILYDYGNKLLEVYQDDKTLTSKWVSNMQLALEKLKIKLESSI